VRFREIKCASSSLIRAPAFGRMMFRIVGRTNASRLSRTTRSSIDREEPGDNNDGMASLFQNIPSRAMIRNLEQV
jgi:hypothetical protein